MLEVKVQKDNSITISGIAFDKKGKPSASGKSLVCATTNGFTQVVVDGEIYSIGINMIRKG